MKKLTAIILSVFLVLSLFSASFSFTISALTPEQLATGARAIVNSDFEQYDATNGFKDWFQITQGSNTVSQFLVPHTDIRNANNSVTNGIPYGGSKSCIVKKSLNAVTGQPNYTAIAQDVTKYIQYNCPNPNGDYSFVAVGFGKLVTSGGYKTASLGPCLNVKTNSGDNLYLATGGCAIDNSGLWSMFGWNSLAVNDDETIGKFMPLHMKLNYTGTIISATLYIGTTETDNKDFIVDDINFWMLGGKAVPAGWTPPALPEPAKPGYKSNLLKNPSFENVTGTNPIAGWYSHNEGNVPVSPSKFISLASGISHTGTKSALVFKANAGTTAEKGWTAITQDVTAAVKSNGKGKYYATGFVKMKAGTANVGATLYIEDDTDADRGGEWYSSAKVNCDTTKWSQTSIAIYDVDPLSINRNGVVSDEVTWSGNLRRATVFISTEENNTNDFYVDDMYFWKVGQTVNTVDDTIPVATKSPGGSTTLNSSNSTTTNTSSDCESDMLSSDLDMTNSDSSNTSSVASIDVAELSGSLKSNSTSIAVYMDTLTVALYKQHTIKELSDSLVCDPAFSVAVVDSKGKIITDLSKVVNKDMKVQLKKDDAIRNLRIQINYNEPKTNNNILIILAIGILALLLAGGAVFYLLKIRKIKKST